MGIWGNIKKGLDAARNPPTQAEIEASLQHLTPEQRAKYDANMAQVAQAQQQSQDSWQQAQALNQQARVLEGPAGRWLYGASMQDAGSPAEMAARFQQEGIGGILKQQLKLGGEDLKAGLKQTVRKTDVPEEKDPHRRAEIAQQERAQRDEARRPYCAGDAQEIVISRLATRGKSQLDELTQHLAMSGLSARPDLVYGLYRVPDRISQTLTPHSEKGRVVEWDIVHAPLPPDTTVPAPPPERVTFAADEQWVARREGEPSVLDEDLALAYLAHARLGPADTLGIARVPTFRSLRGEGSSDGGSGPIRGFVTGVTVLHAPGRAQAFDELEARRPLGLQPGDEHRIDVLNWHAIAQVVHPRGNHPPATPSPFPYLPSTPQELLKAYLQVVGLRPEDCVSAQCTINRVTSLELGGLMTTNVGPKQPCADGTPRMRAHGTRLVVVAYRDTPSYAEGRDRWDAYGRDVLQADLRKGVALRPPIDTGAEDNRLLKALDRFSRIVDIDEWGAEHIPPYRYCLPPVG